MTLTIEELFATPMLDDEEMALVQANPVLAAFLDLRGRATLADIARMAGLTDEGG